MGAEGIINNRGEKSKENHNTEGAYSMPREIKDSHKETRCHFRMTRGEGEMGGYDLKKKKASRETKRGERVLLASNFS